MSDNRSGGTSTTTIVMVIVAAALICFPCAGVVVFGALGMILFTAVEKPVNLESPMRVESPPMEVYPSTEEPNLEIELREEFPIPELTPLLPEVPPPMLDDVPPPAPGS